MAVDGLLEVGHAIIADLYRVAVEDLMQHMVLGKFLVKNFEKLTSNVGGYISTVWWIVPNYFPLTIPISYVIS